MLPRLDGLEVCRAIRRTSTVPIVMLTARADTIDVVVGLEAGRRRLRQEAVRGARARRAGPGGAAPRRPRTGRRRATPPRAAGDRPRRADGRPATGATIPLTRTEFDLLVELARHAGQVLSRDVLLDRIWGYDYLGDSRLVDVAIGACGPRSRPTRRNPELILTVRGAGYKAAR